MKGCGWDCGKTDQVKTSLLGSLGPKQYVFSLLVVFACETHVGEKINFDERFGKMEKVLKRWSGRRLKLPGYIAIVHRMVIIGERFLTLILKNSEALFCFRRVITI